MFRGGEGYKVLGNFHYGQYHNLILHPRGGRLPYYDFLPTAVSISGNHFLHKMKKQTPKKIEFPIV